MPKSQNNPRRHGLLATLSHFPLCVVLYDVTHRDEESQIAGDF
jgi:hypothetical protein